MVTRVFKKTEGVDRSFMVSGDIWEECIPLNTMPGGMRIDSGTIRTYDVKISRDPDWADYLIFPVYKVFYVADEDCLEQVTEEEGRSIADEAYEDAAQKGSPYPFDLEILKGVIGSNRPGNRIMYPRDVMPERFLINIQNYQRTIPYIIITSKIYEAMKLTDLGYKNVVSCMNGDMTIAQELFVSKLPKYGMKAAILVNVSNADSVFGDENIKFGNIIRLSFKIKPDNVVVDTKQLDSVLKNVTKGEFHES